MIVSVLAAFVIDLFLLVDNWLNGFDWFNFVFLIK